MIYGNDRPSHPHHLHRLAETPPPSLPPELELQSLWFAGNFGREFTTTAGLPVRIIQFGEWNRGAGPDFVHAAVEIAGRVKRGAIEIDSTAADWDHHGHGMNPAFGDVALHVVFRKSTREAFTRGPGHREIPRVEIDEALLATALDLPRRKVALAKPGRCLPVIARLPEAAVASLLEEAAAYRATRKAARFLRTEDAHGREASLFQSTAETLGYGGNALPMRVLSQRAPLSSHKDGGAEALLFGNSGFLSPLLHEQAPPDTRDYLRGLWDTWWKHRGRFECAGRPAIPWIRHGQRPANHPHRRIGTLTALAAVWPKFRRIALASPFDPDDVIRFLAALDHPFWSTRHTLTSKPSARPLALFGRAQALELLANHLIPLAIHEERYDLTRYGAIRAGAPNDPVKRCVLRLFGSLEAGRPWLRRVSHHQALLQIYRDFCLEDASDCEACPFPGQLRQWNPQ